MRTVVAELVDAVTVVPERDVALLGFCSGAIIALEVARELERTEARRLAHLFVVSQLSPRSLHVEPAGGAKSPASQAVLPHEAEVLELLGPVLEADMRLVDDYEYVASSRLSVPLTVLRGGADPTVTSATVEGWSEETNHEASFRTIPTADHLFTGSAWPALAREVSDALGAS